MRIIMALRQQYLMYGSTATGFVSTSQNIEAPGTNEESTSSSSKYYHLCRCLTNYNEPQLDYPEWTVTAGSPGCVYSEKVEKKLVKRGLLSGRGRAD